MLRWFPKTRVGICTGGDWKACCRNLLPSGPKHKQIENQQWNRMMQLTKSPCGFCFMLQKGLKIQPPKLLFAIWIVHFNSWSLGSSPPPDPFFVDLIFVHPPWLSGLDSPNKVFACDTPSNQEQPSEDSSVVNKHVKVLMVQFFHHVTLFFYTMWHLIKTPIRLNVLGSAYFNVMLGWSDVS